jgi:hypothetical protein
MTGAGLDVAVERQPTLASEAAMRNPRGLQRKRQRTSVVDAPADAPGITIWHARLDFDTNGGCR